MTGVCIFVSFVSSHRIPSFAIPRAAMTRYDHAVDANWAGYGPAQGLVIYPLCFVCIFKKRNPLDFSRMGNK